MPQRNRTASSAQGQTPFASVGRTRPERSRRSPRPPPLTLTSFLTLVTLVFDSKFLVPPLNFCSAEWVLDYFQVKVKSGGRGRPPHTTATAQNTGPATPSAGCS